MKSGILRGCAVAALIGGVFVGGTASAKDVVIHAGKLIDGVSATPRTQVSILIRDDRVTGVQSGFVTPAGAEVIDLSTKTVLPGFIESHDHISSNGDRRPLNRFTLTTGDATLAAVANARRLIEEGFTTVRDLGSDGVTAPALIRAISAKQIARPMPPLAPVTRTWMEGESVFISAFTSWRPAIGSRGSCWSVAAMPCAASRSTADHILQIDR